MHEFQCGHQECSSSFTASDKEYLKVQIADHLRDAHNVQTPTETIMTYLVDTCVRRAG
jgi:predicted small metal-binding protein